MKKGTQGRNPINVKYVEPVFPGKGVSSGIFGHIPAKSCTAACPAIKRLLTKVASYSITSGMLGRNPMNATTAAKLLPERTL